jgi:hypothetical protein
MQARISQAPRRVVRVVGFGWLATFGLTCGEGYAQNAADQCRDVLITAAHNINQHLNKANISTLFRRPAAKKWPLRGSLKLAVGCL